MDAVTAGHITGSVVSPTVAGLHHLEFYVADLERTAAFWGGLLAKFGYEPFQEWDEGISFRTAGVSFVFVAAPPEGDELDRRSAGLNHIAFGVDTASEVDDLRQELAAAGVRMLYDDRYPHAGGEDHYAVFFEDPDGLKVEVVASV